MTRIRTAKKFLLFFLLLITLSANLFAASGEISIKMPQRIRAKLVQTKASEKSYYLCENKKKLKDTNVLSGPFENAEQVVLVWIHNGYHANDVICIAKARTNFVTANPIIYFGKVYATVSADYKNLGFDATFDKYFLGEYHTKFDNNQTVDEKALQSNLTKEEKDKIKELENIMVAEAKAQLVEGKKPGEGASTVSENADQIIAVASGEEVPETPAEENAPSETAVETQPAAEETTPPVEQPVTEEPAAPVPEPTPAPAPAPVPVPVPEPAPAPVIAEAPVPEPLPPVEKVPAPVVTEPEPEPQKPAKITSKKAKSKTAATAEAVPENTKTAQPAQIPAAEPVPAQKADAKVAKEETAPAVPAPAPTPAPVPAPAPVPLTPVPEPAPEPQQDSLPIFDIHINPETKTASVSRYQKEYLQDYIPVKKIELPKEETATAMPVIENPDKKDSGGKTLLMKAAKSGNDWEIQSLLNSGADVNLKDNDGWSALMYAVRYQENNHIISLLIDAGAEIKTTNNYELSPLILAATYNGNPEILKTLLSYYSPSEKEVTSAFVMLLTDNSISQYAKIAKINTFLSKSIPLNSFYKGKTLLMYAAQYGNSTQIIKLLLDNGAITSIRSTEGKTAFDYAKANKALAHDDIFWALNKK